MTDDEARSLLRKAQATGDALAWGRAAQAFARLRRAPELVAASSREHLRPLLDGLTPPLSEFRVQVFGPVRLGDRPGTLRYLSWSRSGRLVALHRNHVVEVDPENGERKILATIESQHVTDSYARVLGPAAISPDGKKAAVCLQEQRAREIHVADLETGEVTQTSWAREISSIGIAGDRLAIADSDGAHLVERGRRKVSVPASTAHVARDAIAYATSDRVFLRPIEASEPEIAVAMKGVTAVRSTGTRVLAIGETLSLVDESGVVHERPYPVPRSRERTDELVVASRIVALYARRLTAVRAGEARTLELLDLDTGERRSFAPEVNEWQRMPVDSLAWSPTGRKLAVGLWDQRLAVFDAEVPLDEEKELRESDATRESWRRITDEDRRRWGF